MDDRRLRVGRRGERRDGVLRARPHRRIDLREPPSRRPWRRSASTALPRFRLRLDRAAVGSAARQLRPRIGTRSPSLAVNALGIVVVALLSGYLAERLRRTGGALARPRVPVEAAGPAMLGRLAAGLAQIRNPLGGSISGSIELLREAPGLGDGQTTLCDIIQREAGRLNHLVTDAMDLARPRSRNRTRSTSQRSPVTWWHAARFPRSGAGDVAVAYDSPDGPLLATMRRGTDASGALEPRPQRCAGDGRRHHRDGIGARDRRSHHDGGRRRGAEGIDPGAERKIFDAFFDPKQRRWPRSGRGETHHRPTTHRSARRSRSTVAATRGRDLRG